MARGSGAIVWRLGLNGDFAYNSNAVWPEFSHQHDAHYEGPFLVVYDNGNFRFDTLGPAENSRGQVLLLDEANRIAHLVGNFDLGVYSPAVGSAERLTNGNYYFLNGLVANSWHKSMEVLPNGEPSFVSIGAGRIYRAFRVLSLYEP